MSSPVASPEDGIPSIPKDPQNYPEDDSPVESSSENSESENSDDGAERRKARKVKETVKELLTKVLADMIDGRKDFKDLKPDELSRLATKTVDSREPTALHMLAVKNTEDLPPSEKLEPLVVHLVKQPARLLAEKDDASLTPLYLAISERKRKMVKWMCQACDDIDSVLSISSHQNRNCLHVAIEKRVKFADFLVVRASERTMSAKDNDGNTPLHLAVEYKRCKKGQLAIVEAIIQRCDRVMRDSPDGDFNNAAQSPYRHHLDTCEKGKKAEAEKEKRKKEEVKQRTKAEKEAERTGARGRPDGDGPAGRDGGSKGTKPMPPKAPAPRAPSQDKHPEPKPLQRTGTQLMEAPFAPKKEPPPGKESGRYGAGQLRVNNVGTPIVGPAPDWPVPERGDDKKGSRRKDAVTSQPDTKESNDSAVMEIRNYLKLHYLRSRGHDAALEILYGRNTTLDQAIYFDLSGYPTMSQTGIQKTISILNFEDILQYVEIPKINIEGDSNMANSKRPRGGSSKADGEGRTDLVKVFSALSSRGVTTILKVIVDDLASPAHSDTAIEAALEKKGVEIWWWKKYDLCSEVIRKVAPKVKEVHMYWSGNNAVLRGWSEEGGLKQLGDQLETIHLHVQQGLETRARTRDSVAKFIDRMRTLCPKVHVEPHWPERAREVSDIDGVRTVVDLARPPRHEWIQCMAHFKEMLVNAEHNAESYLGITIDKHIEERIVVALIDDGINVNETEFRHIDGRSFCRRDEEGNLNYPYYVSSGGHGTIMASQISRICPTAALYVLKLEDYVAEPPTRQITFKSAAQAIRAAVRKKVHIISMSWTIDVPENENQDVRDLKTAISEAAEANILMFCAASDKGAKHTSSYPSKATNNIFTIGAADASGIMASYVGDINSVDFIFPGKKVEPEGLGEAPTKDVDYWTGSSVATALAAGLAALILYCAQIRLLRAPATQKEKARRDFQALKKHEKMLQAFKMIGPTTASRGKYLAVWEVFGRKVAQSESCDREKWIDLVAEVGEDLCRRL